MASGPSMSADSASAGSGTTSDDHTVSDSAPSRFAGATGPAFREMTLPIAQESAASRASTTARAGASPPRPSATTPSPTVPTSTPIVCIRVGRSRRASAATTIVSTTCACSRSAAMPGCRPSAIEV